MSSLRLNCLNLQTNTDSTSLISDFSTQGVRDFYKCRTLRMGQSRAFGARVLTSTSQKFIKPIRTCDELAGIDTISQNRAQNKLIPGLQTATERHERHLRDQ